MNLIKVNNEAIDFFVLVQESFLTYALWQKTTLYI